MVPEGGAWSRGGGLHGRGGAWSWGGCLMETPPTAAAVGGTHPTGMHSCSNCFEDSRAFVCSPTFQYKIYANWQVVASVHTSLFTMYFIHRYSSILGAGWGGDGGLMRVV